MSEIKEQNVGISRENEEPKGVSIRTLNNVIIIVACILSLALLASTLNTMRGYKEMQEATERYVLSEQDASMLQSGSDYLTAQVRAFVMTGEKVNLDNYLKEVQVTKRRDRAVESIETLLADDVSNRYLSDALTYSNELIGIEYYAMKLRMDAMSWPEDEQPEELRSIELSPADKTLDVETKIRKASLMLFDETYQSYKDRISENVERCMETLIGETRAQQEQDSRHLLSLLRVQTFLIIGLLCAVIALVILSNRFIIRPLQSCIEHIRKHESLPLTGSAELRFLSHTYNVMYERSMQQQDKLSYEASHDALTGLYNRSFFENLRRSSDQENIAMMIIDFDHFKEINDTYGHGTGDLMLQKLARVLTKSFRAEDRVCRIGGDEFAVVMVNADSGLKDLVYSKIKHANEVMGDTSDGLPKASISVGVAFSDRENPTDDIFKDADTALYRVKESGRADCAFY